MGTFSTYVLIDVGHGTKVIKRLHTKKGGH